MWVCTVISSSDSLIRLSCIGRLQIAASQSASWPHEESIPTRGWDGGGRRGCGGMRDGGGGDEMGEGRGNRE